jgi:ribonuclease D
LTHPRAYRYIVKPDEAREVLCAFTHQPIIGLDTETYWDAAVRQNRISLLQLAAPTGEVVVVDALEAGLEEAREMIENPAPLMAAHNARFDEGVLSAAGLAPLGLIDTLRLARLSLRLPSFSLSAVTEHLFGLTLDKSYQRSDWRRRPLTKRQLDYAALDAQIVLRVYQTLTERLEREGRLVEGLGRARLCRADASGVVSEKALRASRRPSLQLRPLTPDERRVVERLRQWRRRLAEREHIPPYLICPDKTLEHLAIARPRSLEDLTSIFGLGPLKIAKYGIEMLTELKER